MFTMLKQGNHYIDDKHGIYTEFVCSSVADVENLPTGANSEALDRPRPGSTADEQRNYLTDHKEV